MGLVHARECDGYLISLLHFSSKKKRNFFASYYNSKNVGEREGYIQWRMWDAG
jgi:hypothetical protein